MQELEPARQLNDVRELLRDRFLPRSISAGRLDTSVTISARSATGFNGDFAIAKELRAGAPNRVLSNASLDGHSPRRATSGGGNLASGTSLKGHLKCRRV
jgi:hypothetical protein